jgi:glycerophosphoryl diester phosphodiesterase
LTRADPGLKIGRSMRASFIAVLAAAFGVLLGTLRLVVMAGFAREPAVVDALLMVPGHIAVGIVLAAVVAPGLPIAVRGLGWVLIALTVAGTTACLHYMAVFGTPPGADALYYLRETRHLASSIESAAPIAWVVVEVLAGVTLLALLSRRLSRDETRAPAWFPGVVLGVAAIGAALNAFPGWSAAEAARLPLLAFAHSASAQPRYSAGDASLSGDDVRLVQSRLGRALPRGGTDARYPLCDRSPTPPPPPNGRSVILLVLESVSAVELAEEQDGKPLMPALLRIARENVHLDRVFAAGDKSCQALPALLAGVPPQTRTNLLWHSPLNELDGLPGRLAAHGYRTVYFHGSDLAFEQQRAFLRRAGVAEIHELDPTADTPVYGWGYSDGEMFDRLRRWLDDSHGDDAPYFATLFTLSTHHPYDLPPDAPPAAEDASDRDNLFRALRYLDGELAELYAWYEREARPRGAVLVITADHVSLDTPTRVPAFRVPLIIAGLDDDERERAQARAQRLGAHHDLPATISGLLGTRPGPCDQGIDLLADDVPEDRWVYSVSGEQRAAVFVRGDDWLARVDRARHRIAMIEQAEGAAPPTAEEVGAFMQRVEALSDFLVDKDAFAPPRARPKRRPPRAAPVATLVASHRGNTRGEDAFADENTPEAVARAIAAGFEWVEVDVQVTFDGVPVLMHDDTFTDGEGKTRHVPGLTFEEVSQLTGRSSLEALLERFHGEVDFLVELKPQRTVQHNLALAHAVARLVKRYDDTRFLVDSFSRTLASSVALTCGCEVGLDAPPGPVTDAWLGAAVEAGMTWAYVKAASLDDRTVARIHEHGLKAMVYTVNAPEDFARLPGARPDGVITDVATLIERAGRER